MPPSRTTLVIVGICSLVSLATLAGGAWDQVVGLAGFVPARVLGLMSAPGALPVWLTPLSASLLHGGLVHLLFNMLVLAYCGRATETVVGGSGMVALFVGGAYAAALAQFLAEPASTVPMIGASGAASAVIAAYAIFYGERRPTLRGRPMSRGLHLLWLAAGWIGLQLLIGFATTDSGMLIAVAAHIGGFLAGLALARPLLRWRYRNA